MGASPRWDPCVAHEGAEVDTFVREYFPAAGRRVVFVGGAGFDPRSIAVASLLLDAGVAAKAILIQERRPNPRADLLARAEGNATTLTTVFSGSDVVPVEIFAADNAVVGGRNAVAALHGRGLGEAT